MQEPTPAAPAPALDLDAALAVQATQHAAVRDLPAPVEAPEVVCDELGCRAAYSHRDECRCSCGGDGHGIQWRTEAGRGRAAMRARIERAGSAFALLPAVDDDEW